MKIGDSMRSKHMLIKKDPSKFNIFDKIAYFSHFICKSFLYAVFSLMLVLAVMFTVYYVDLLTNVKTGNSKFPIFGSYVILTQSMIPTINVNDAVLVKRSDLEEFDVGDIITFSSLDRAHTGMTITHRIVGKQHDKAGNSVFRTKGDNNFKEDDSYVPYNNIYGKVILRMPKLGYIQKFISKPLGLITSIFIPILLVILVDGFRLFIYYNKVRNE